MTQSNFERWHQREHLDAQSKQSTSLKLEVWQDARTLWLKAPATVSDDAILDFATGQVVIDQTNDDRLKPGKPGEMVPGSKNDAVGRWQDAQTKVIIYPDGRQEVRNKAGAGFTQIENVSGDIEQNYSGNGIKSGFRIVTAGTEKHFYSADGLVEFKPSEKHEISAEHARLLKLMAEEVNDPIKLAKFEADLCKLEYRGMQANLPDSQIADTYKQIERLLQSAGTSTLTEEQLNDVAMQILSNAASPTTIDQGGHPTCNVTTIEACMYTTEPSTAAKLVADVALTGLFTSKDGVTVNIDEKPHDSARSYWVKDGQRNHASEIFQMTAVNLYYQQYENGNVRYELSGLEPSAVIVGGGHSDQLKDYSKHPPKLLSNTPALDCAKIALIYAAITTDISKVHVLEQGGKADKEVPGLQSFDTESDLLSYLRAAKESGSLPVIIRVYPNNDPFFSDQNLAALSREQSHVVTIADFKDGAPPVVSMDNQWGTSKDHLEANPLDVHTLFLATLPVSSKLLANSLRRDVDDLKEQGTFDVSKELQAILHERAAGLIDETKYLEEFQQLLLRFETLNPTACANSSNETSECKSQFEKLLDRAIDKLPANLSISLMQFEKEQGWLSQENYEKELIQWGKKFKRLKSNAEKTSPVGGAVEGILQRASQPLELAAAMFDSILAELPEPALRRILAAIDETSSTQESLMTKVGS